MGHLNGMAIYHGITPLVCKIVSAFGRAGVEREWDGKVDRVFRLDPRIYTTTLKSWDKQYSIGQRRGFCIFKIHWNAEGPELQDVSTLIEYGHQVYWELADEYATVNSANSTSVIKALSFRDALDFWTSKYPDKISTCERVLGELK